MANQSIYDERWIDLVFEDRNKAYGAYQLRNENPKTTLKALFIGFLLLLFMVSIPMFLQKTGNQDTIITDRPLPLTPLTLTEVIFKSEKAPETASGAPLTQKKPEASKPDVNQSNLVDPTVTSAQNATTVIAPTAQPVEPFVEPVEGAILGNQNSGVLGGTDTESGSNAGSNLGTTGGIHVPVALDKQPEFPGGMNKFYKYVAQNFVAPETEIANTIKVYVSFVIEKDGTMTDIRVPRNPGFGLDKEAIRVLKSLKTKWNPGIINGQPVRTAYNLPIVVQQK